MFKYGKISFANLHINQNNDMIITQISCNINIYVMVNVGNYDIGLRI